MENSNKVALVTGGNKGIGKGIVIGLAQKGYKVIIGSRNLEKGTKTQSELSTDGLNVDVVQLDINDNESIQAAVKYIQDKYGKLDVLQNNAGIVLDDGLNSIELDEQIIIDTLNTNTLGAFRVTKAFLNLLRKSDDSRVINMSSKMGALKDMGTGNLAYRISKTSLNTVSKVLAQELAAENIKIYTMSPGWVKTDMGGAGAPKSITEGADTAVWLASEDPAPSTNGFYEDRSIIDW